MGNVDNIIKEVEAQLNLQKNKLNSKHVENNGIIIDTNDFDNFSTNDSNNNINNSNSNSNNNNDDLNGNNSNTYYYNNNNNNNNSNNNSNNGNDSNDNSNNVNSNNNNTNNNNTNNDNSNNGNSNGNNSHGNNSNGNNNKENNNNNGNGSNGNSNNGNSNNGINNNGNNSNGNNNNENTQPVINVQPNNDHLTPNYPTTTVVSNSLPTSVSENLNSTGSVISTSSSNNGSVSVPTYVNNHSSHKNKWEGINSKAFSINGFNVTYLYIIIFSGVCALLLSLLLLTCIIRKKNRNKRKHMRLIDVDDSNNLRQMLDENTSNDYYDNYDVNARLLDHNYNNDGEYREYENYYRRNNKHFKTIPFVKNPNSAHGTGKTIDRYQSDYNRMSMSQFPTSSPSELYRKSGAYDRRSSTATTTTTTTTNKSYNNNNNEFDSGYNYFSPNMKANKSIRKSTSLNSSKKSPQTKGINSPLSTNYMDYIDNVNTNVNNKNNINSINNNYSNNNRNKNDLENNIMDNNDDLNIFNKLYPEENDLDNNYYKNLFSEKKYKSMPRLGSNNHLMNFDNKSNKKYSLSTLPPSNEYNMKFNNDYLYSSSSTLNKLTPAKNSLPSYMTYNNGNPNSVNKMVSTTNRLSTSTLSSTVPMKKDDESLILPPVTVLNNEELINETERYPVDNDYVAKYAYKPMVDDELFISTNDRIHLLQTYSDGWAYGKNVTTGRLGVFPLNRLSSIKRTKKENSDKESEKTKINSETSNSASKIISYSLQDLQRKSASQDSLANSSSNNYNQTYTTTYSSTRSSERSNSHVNSRNSINSSLKPKKSRTLIVKNLSEEDLRDKSNLDFSSFERKKENVNQYINNIRDNVNKMRGINYKNLKDEDFDSFKDSDYDSVLHIKSNLDDIKFNKPSTTYEQIKSDINKKNYFEDIYIPY